MVLRPMAGGMRTVTDQYIELLSAGGVEVIAAGPLRTLPHSVPGQPLEMFPYGRSTRQLQEISRSLRPDLLHAHGLQAGVASRGLSVPVVYTCHGSAPSGPAGGLFRILEAGVMRQAAALSATSLALAKDAAKRSGRAVAALPVALFVPADEQIASRPRGPVIGTLARLTPEKGLNVLLEAFFVFLRAHPGARLLVGGDGPLAPALAQEVSAAGLGERVRLLGWVEPAAFYPQLDLYTQPSLREGLGLAARQAVAWGLPVVASEVGGLMEACGDGPWVRYVPPGDASALAQAWQETYAQDPTKIARSGRLWARSVSGPDAVRQALLQLYEQALNAPVNERARQRFPA